MRVSCVQTETADAAVERDVVEVRLGGDAVPIILLTPVSQIEDLLLAVRRVRVEVHLAVHAVDCNAPSAAAVGDRHTGTD